jgi:type IV pilus assembly protein PilF
MYGCVTKTSSNQPKLTDKKLAESHYKMGLAYLEGSKDYMAMKEFEEALKYDPNNGNIHYAISTFYLKRNDLVNAEKYIKKAMEIQPDNPEYINAYASILAAKGNLEEALAAWKKVLESPTYPTMERVYYNMGYLLYEHSRYNEAKEYFKKSIEVSRTFMLPYLYLYRISQLHNNVDESEKILKKALDNHPLFLPIMFELGKFYFENNRYADAAKQFTKILEIYPKSEYAPKAKVYLHKMGIFNE